MQSFRSKLDSGKFVLTAELNPPKGTDLESVLQKGEELKDSVDAINVTDSQSSIMCISPIAVSHHLIDMGIDPILQITARDRNRLAIQSDMLGAYTLGVNNILCLTGDPPHLGDHPDAKPVFDLDGVSLITAANVLASGNDLSKNKLKGSPKFYIGAAANPGSDDVDNEIKRMEDKVAAGACFFQTQAIFEPGIFAAFLQRAEHIDVPIIAGIIVLKSPKMAQYMNEHIPGINVPKDIIHEIDVDDKASKAIEIAARLTREIRDMSRGVHLMAIGWERYIPQIVEQAGL